MTRAFEPRRGQSGGRSAVPAAVVFAGWPDGRGERQAVEETGSVVRGQLAAIHRRMLSTDLSTPTAMSVMTR